MVNALSGVDKLRENVDTLIVIPNDKLLEIVDRRTTFPDALKKADEVLQQAVQGITDLINMPALINLDFADVQTVMKDKGLAHIGIGMAKVMIRQLRQSNWLLPVHCLRQLSMEQAMLLSIFPVIFLLWMPMMQQAM